MNERTIHRVKSGETLGHIAGKYGVRVSEIKRWNGLRSDMIQIGQRIVVYPRKL
jgi:membrane-bound lytic murein transglycosylase D